MRHLFDQYEQPENRLTHALVSALRQDPSLLKGFIRWATNAKPPRTSLTVVEQTLPGQEEPQEEAQAKGLPDAWIHDADGWSLILESKIGSPLTRDQLQRHFRTAERRGFKQPHLLALVVEPPRNGALDGTRVTMKRWTDLYCWLLNRNDSTWARELAMYMEVLEQKLVRDSYPIGGTLTVFTGIPFGKDEPYNYFEAKRLLRLAMDQLRQRKDLQEQLGTDPQSEGRSAITGRDGTGVWNFLRLRQSKSGKSFTEFPHFTLGVGFDHVIAIVIVPNSMRPVFRRNLLAGGSEQFCALFEQILANFKKSLKNVEGATPWVEVVQRRYRSQRSEPILDGRLQFDLRTAFKDWAKKGNSVKHQPQWLTATYEALCDRNSNLQLAVGAIFPFDRCAVIHTPQILDCVGNVWLGCKPLVNKLLGGSRKRREL